MPSGPSLDPWSPIRIRAALAVILVAFGLGIVAPVATANQDRQPRRGALVPRPQITMPPAGIREHALWDSYYDLSAYGYEEQEYFVTGTATAASSTAPYTTRIIVFRPDTIPHNGPEFKRHRAARLGERHSPVRERGRLPRGQRDAAARGLRVGARECPGGRARHTGAEPVGAEEVWDPVRYAAISHSGNYGEQVHPMMGTCTLAGATMPMHYATSSAIAHLDAWVRHGTVPPSGLKTDTNQLGSVTNDGFGNARGGIRLAPIVVPVATYVSNACQLGGKTVPFSEAQLLAMYGTHEHCYELFERAVAQDVTDGWLLPVDATDLLARACDSRNRFGIPQVVTVPYCEGFAKPPL